MSDLTLAEFLGARYDEEQLGAQDAADWDGDGSEHLEWKHAYGMVVAADDEDQAVIGSALGETTPAVAEHIARHDPARVLREVEAGRKILDTYRLFLASSRPDVRPRRGSYDAVIRVLAAVYDSHPDYREEWKP